MDRRVIAIIFVIALILALLVGFLTAPDTGAGPVELPSADPKPAQGVVQQAARPARATPTPPQAVLDQKVVGQPKRPFVFDPKNPGQVATEPVPMGMNAEDPESRRQYRCRALGQQADLIDRLMVVGAGTGVDEDQRKQMVSRVAQLSTRVFDEGEALWSGDLSCEGFASVNLSKASDFLATQSELLELDDKTTAEVNQALGVLDTVDWDATE